MKNLTKEQLKKDFELALLQYFTIDKNICEKFGSLVQGFITVKIGDQAHIIPFTIIKAKDVDKLLEKVLKLETHFLGISIVQHYIHYTSGAYNETPSPSLEKPQLK